MCLVVNIDLNLQSNDGDNCFMVKPEELLLRTGEEQDVVVTFSAQSNRKNNEWYVGVCICFNYMAKCMTAHYFKFLACIMFVFVFSVY